MAEPDIHMHCAHSYDWVARDSMHAVLRYALAQRLPGYGQCMASANAECTAGFLSNVDRSGFGGLRWRGRIENREVAAYIAAKIVRYAARAAWHEVLLAMRGNTYLAAVPLDMRRIVESMAHPLGYPHERMNPPEGRGAYKHGLPQCKLGLCRYTASPREARGWRDNLVQLHIINGKLQACSSIYAAYPTVRFKHGYIYGGDAEMCSGQFNRRLGEFYHSYAAGTPDGSTCVDHPDYDAECNACNYKRRHPVLYNFELADRHALLE